MATRIQFDAELTRESLEAVREDIDRLLAGTELPGTDMQWRIPTVAERQVDQLWPRLGDHLQRLIKVSATDFEDAESFTFEDLAGKLDEEIETVKSWHRNLSRSLKRVEREVGPGLPVLDGSWSDADGRMHYRMPAEMRRAVLAKIAAS